MTHLEDNSTFAPEEFTGRARLFPLPNLVLFPHVIQPLHIFEPRYVDLLHDALSSDRMITMSLLERGWEENYDGRPPIAEVSCLARVLTWQALPQKRYNLLVAGLHRVRVVRELPPCKSFREAEVEVLEDEYPMGSAEIRPALHKELATAFEEVLPLLGESCEMFDQLSTNTVSLGTLTDLISYALDLNVRAKQALLSERNVDRRAKRLLAFLHEAADEARQERVPAGFPPAFSTN